VSEELAQIEQLNEAYTTLVQKLRQTSLMAFGGPLNTGARKRTVRTAIESAGLGEKYYEYRGVQSDGRYSTTDNSISGAPKTLVMASTYQLVSKEDLNRVYPSASGGWFGVERLPDEIAELVPPMGFRDLNALTQVSFRALDSGAKGKAGKATSNLAVPVFSWPAPVSATAISGYERQAEQELRIPLGYIDAANTRIPTWHTSRDDFDDQIDAFITYFEGLGYLDIADYDGRSFAKNADTWASVAIVGAVVQVIGTLLKMVPVPPVQAVGQVLEIAGQITVFAAQAALAGDLFDSSDAVDLLSDSAYVALQAYSLMADGLGMEAREEVQLVIDDLTSAANEYAANGDPEAWLSVFPDDSFIRAAARSWLECLSPNPAIGNRNANSILLGASNYALTGSKLGAIPEAPALLLGTTEDGLRIPLPALGSFPLPTGQDLAAINSGFPDPKEEAGSAGLILAGLLGAFFLLG